MSALRKVSVRIMLNAKTIKEVLVATVLTVTKETIVATLMSVTKQVLVVTRTPNASTLMEASLATVTKVFTEMVTGAFRVNVRTAIVLKTKNAFQQRPLVVNANKASNSAIHLSAKMSMSANRPSATIKKNV